MDIKAVIFDLDGVIVSTDQLHYKAWKFMADKEHIYFDEKINHRLRGVSRMASLEIILEKSQKEYTDEEKKQLAKLKNDYYVELLKMLDSKDILEGVLETIRYLKKKGIKIAIGSSSKNTPIILKQIGLNHMFDAISDGNDITHSKPHPEVFLNASGKLGINPINCLVVEDAVSGIIAAKNANMYALAVSDARISNIADFKLNKLIDIKTII